MTTIETLDSHRARDSVETQSTEQTGSGSPRLILSLECRRPTVPGYRLMMDRLDEIIVARDTSRRIERNKRTATVYVSDFQVSRQHLAIRRLAAGWRLDDLGSKNGTAVNGERVD